MAGRWRCQCGSGARHLENGGEPLALKTPKRLEPLIEDGLIDEVVRQLMSGKEATVYVVRCGGEVRCAKVYK